jgi:RNA recognition motif-containing protein
LKLYVGNLSSEVTDAELNALAVKFGELKASNVARDRSGSSKGFAFLEFGSAEEAKAAIDGLNGREIGGRMIKVSEARNQTPKDVLGGRY